jgi:rSAM/selenodomain-associated transferase 2
VRRPVSVIIAALDEEVRIGAAIDSAFAAGAAEVLVADGASDDRTAAIAAQRGARVLSCERMRARQLNRGAGAAAHDILLFLHADTTLPPGAIDAVCAALDRGADFGGFRIAFEERLAKLRLAAMLINLRTALTRCPWGDQAQFVRREVFEAAGRYREIPLMEDYDFAIRMQQRGRTAILPLAVHTSGRRFLQKGVLRTAWINWGIVWRFRRGEDPEALAKRYRA